MNDKLSAKALPIFAVPLIERGLLVAFCFSIVRAKLKNLGYEPRSWPSLDLDNDVERICNVRLDGAVRYRHRSVARKL
jgi:hypothetical protein